MSDKPDISKCDYFYKVETEEGFKYYGMKVLTKDSSIIDEILDQINICNGIFIKEEEFSLNIKTPMELDVKDNETETITMATLIFEAINLEDIQENEVVIL